MSKITTTVGQSIDSYADYKTGASQTQIDAFIASAKIPLAGKYNASDAKAVTKSVPLNEVLGGGSSVESDTLTIDLGNYFEWCMGTKFEDDPVADVSNVWYDVLRGLCEGKKILFKARFSPEQIKSFSYEDVVMEGYLDTAVIDYPEIWRLMQSEGIDWDTFVAVITASQEFIDTYCKFSGYVEVGPTLYTNSKTGIMFTVTLSERVVEPIYMLLDHPTYGIAVSEAITGLPNLMYIGRTLTVSGIQEFYYIGMAEQPYMLLGYTKLNENLLDAIHLRGKKLTLSGYGNIGYVEDPQYPGVIHVTADYIFDCIPATIRDVETDDGSEISFVIETATSIANVNDGTDKYVGNATPGALVPVYHRSKWVYDATSKLFELSEEHTVELQPKSNT